MPESRHPARKPARRRRSGRAAGRGRGRCRCAGAGRPKTRGGSGLRRLSGAPPDPEAGPFPPGRPAFRQCRGTAWAVPECPRWCGGGSATRTGPERSSASWCAAGAGAGAAGRRFRRPRTRSFLRSAAPAPRSAGRRWIFRIRTPPQGRGSPPGKWKGPRHPPPGRTAFRGAGPRPAAGSIFSGPSRRRRAFSIPRSDSHPKARCFSSPRAAAVSALRFSQSFPARRHLAARPSFRFFSSCGSRHSGCAKGQRSKNRHPEVC